MYSGGHLIQQSPISASGVELVGSVFGMAFESIVIVSWKLVLGVQESNVAFNHHKHARYVLTFQLNWVTQKSVLPVSEAMIDREDWITAPLETLLDHVTEPCATGKCVGII